MCGIFGFVSDKKLSASVTLEGLKALEYRGYDSWGIAVLNNSKLELEKYTGKIGGSETKLPESNLSLGHTRWATHGGVTADNAHPHFDCKGKIALVHNGIIENYDLIKKGLKFKHVFKSQTDTETAVHLYEENRKKSEPLAALRKTFMSCRGLNALVLIDSDAGKIFAVKNGSPLIIGISRGRNYIASDASALLPHTKKVCFMEDDTLAVISAEKIEMFSVKSGKRIGFKVSRLLWKLTLTEKGKFPHYMLKEIYEQPGVLRNAVNTNIKELKKLAEMIKNTNRVSLVGCGSAYYAAIAGEYLFSGEGHKKVDTFVGSEFNYFLDLHKKGNLVIALSQSGETIDIVDSVKRAMKQGVKAAALTNVLGSSLYRLAELKIMLNAGPEKAVATTKAFTAKLADLVLLACELGGRRDKGKKILMLAAAEVLRVLNDEKFKIEKLAHLISKEKNIFTLGKGLSYPVALEAALKIKEVTYVHAEGFSGGELKHGCIALIKKGTPVIVFLSEDGNYDMILAGAMEVKARGGYIIGISHKPHPVFDQFIKVKDCGSATMIPQTVVAQLLAYYLSVIKGIDPDKPRNLAKSVTVR